MHVQAKDLTHITVPGYIHLWHVVDKQAKSLTNSDLLFILEGMAVFIECEFWSLMHKFHGLKDGFYYANHYTRRGGFVPGKEWSEQVEQELLRRGIISVSTGLDNSSKVTHGLPPFGW